jgi:hypothetical protein
MAGMELTGGRHIPDEPPETPGHDLTGGYLNVQLLQVLHGQVILQANLSR